MDAEKNGLTKEQEAELTDRIKTEMQKVRDNALLSGAKAIAGAVLNMAKDTSKPILKRLEDIEGFCERSLGVAKKNGV